MQIVILRYDALSSTNSEAAAQARRGASEGLCVVAREQTAGRGRLGRVWRSPPGAGLYLSIVVRPRFMLSRFPLLTFAAALAVRDVISDLIVESRRVIDIKYPNDVLINGKKVCGILAEIVETQLGTAAVIGIGINLTNEAVAPDLPFATTLEIVAGKRFDAEIILRELLKSFRTRYAALQEPEGDAATLVAWAAHSSYAEGKRVRVTIYNETFEGTTRGLTFDGALRVELESGEIKIIRAGDVTAVRTTN